MRPVTPELQATGPFGPRDRDRGHRRSHPPRSSRTPRVGVSSRPLVEQAVDGGREETQVLAQEPCISWIRPDQGLHAIGNNVAGRNIGHRDEEVEARHLDIDATPVALDRRDVEDRRSLGCSPAPARPRDPFGERTMVARRQRDREVDLGREYRLGLPSSIVPDVLPAGTAVVVVISELAGTAVVVVVVDVISAVRSAPPPPSSPQPANKSAATTRRTRRRIVGPTGPAIRRPRIRRSAVRPAATRRRDRRPGVR